MKFVSLLWNFFLAVAAIYGLCVFAPRAYQQAHFQFTKPPPLGGSMMWPATFGGFLFLASFFACLAGLSRIFNRELSVAMRVIALVASLMLLAGWFIEVELWARYMTHFPGTLQQSGFNQLLNWGGLPYFTIAIISLIIAAIVGCGPTGLIARRIQKER